MKCSLLLKKHLEEDSLRSPPASLQDVFFDIEGYPLQEGGLEYLLGATYLVNGAPEFKDWWAHDEIQEKKAFEEFIDWSYQRWVSDKSMHIYHYAAYEVTAMKKLAGKYATREREMDDFLRNQVFVDLYTIVRQGLIVGTPSYSLKEIEHLYLEAREGEVTTAGGSVVEYHHWLESGESQDPDESPILGSIRDYNKVDCDSTWKLAEWLRDVQNDNSSIQYIPPALDTRDERLEENVNEHPSKRLANQILDVVESGDILDEKSRHIHQLLGWLLEFHWRESKPVFWRMFARHEMTDQELISDFDCLGSLQRTNSPPVPINRSHLYEYSFDSGQDTKLHNGSNCFFAHDLTIKTTIEEFELGDGLVVIKLGPSVPETPEFLSLIPNEHVRADAISNAILRCVQAWFEGNILSPAVDDLIHRRRPRIDGHDGGDLISDDQELVPAVTDLICRMDQTLLCIQGPPGTGKTYTCAQAILKLLQHGKKVAITANSHSAVLNVLHAVHAAMEEAGEVYPLIKIGPKAGHPVIVNDSLIQSRQIDHIPNSANAAHSLNGGPLVMGGTAWVFSRPELQGEFDYLFVDEAGQFSLANAVATGLCANNIVLVGDQMQLSQPLLGTHPGKSGHSALQYLLGDHATIPPDFGVFLNQTWRLHPKICDFISEAVYEGRLRSHPGTELQKILITGDSTEMVSKTAGVIYVPIEHSDNTQSSVEEADAIEKIVEELIGKTVMGFGGSQSGRISLNDILIVAPFNMQVRLLQNRFGNQARVGSVDKFQGQEAHVVIISMCSSTLEDSPRGAEFLFDPNRLNVAVSRAKTLVLVVGSPALLEARCQTIKEMELLNLYCWLLEHASEDS